MKRKNRCKAKIVLAPNPILTQVCEPVEDGEDVSSIIRDMMHILVNSKTGVGLAAPQAGHLKRIIIVKVRGEWRVMINPAILMYVKKKLAEKEGCLSYPGKFVDIKRSDRIDHSYQNDARETVSCCSWGMVSRIVQHEIDHLNGKCKVGDK